MSSSSAVKETAKNILFKEFEKSTREIFNFYAGNVISIHHLSKTEAEKPLSDCDELNSCTMLGSSVGIANDDFKCSICLLTYSQIVEDMFQGDLENPSDWLGELANQLMGKLKNKLSAFCVITKMSTPVSLRGEVLGFPIQSSDDQVIVVQTEVGDVALLLNYKFDRELDWDNGSQCEIAEEGSVCLF